ncbi:MAG: RNA-binding domain-containing protein [Nitrososphaeraceae archaeon]
MKLDLEKIGITETKDVNQIANFALVEWPDNLDISDLAPSEYFPKYASYMSDEMRYWHGLPEGWEHMKYQDFLAVRRKAMARVIHDAYKQLSNVSSSPQSDEYTDPPLEELIKNGESNTLEFKSSMRWDYNANQKGTGAGQLAILKTIAAFMNSEGGTLLVGVDDSGNILGIENDYETFSDRKNWDGWSQHLVNIVRKQIGTEFMSRIKLQSIMYHNKTVAKIKVQKSNNPIFVEFQDGKSGQIKTEFYSRAINTTQALNTKQANDYIKEHWRL